MPARSTGTPVRHLWERARITDPHIVHGVGGEVLVGRAFVFVQPAAFKRPEVAWVSRMFGAQTVARVLPLFSRESLPVFGAEIDPVALHLHLDSLTSDRAVYRAGRDVVRLLAVRPLLPGTTAVLEIGANGSPQGTRALTLDAHGAGLVELRDLPAGAYDVRFRGADPAAPPCSFVVAEYRLAPLVAALVERRLEGSRLSIMLRLETFGVPVDGDVQVDLLERGRRASRVQGRCREGLMSVDLDLSGEGPFEVALQLLEHPSRTASVPLVGSRAEERSLTPFSTLGTEVSGSLLPFEGARAVRGIWLDEGATRTTPFRLERVDARTARLVAAVDAESAVLGVLDPSQPRPRAGAPDATDARHPIFQDPLYQTGVRLFGEGEMAMALTAFRERRSRDAAPHPYLAYYEACCLARMGRPEEALGALRLSVEDGWRDFAHMAADDDLAGLRGQPAFTSLCEGGWREVRFDRMKAGQAVELDVPGPVAIVAIGAFVQGRPWEGWAATVAPSALSPAIEVPRGAEPGQDVTIEVRTGGSRDAKVYLVVKDSRLPSPDTPENRLAAGMKALVEAAGRELAVGHVEETLQQALPPPPPPPLHPVIPSAVPGPPRGGGLFGRARDLFTPTLYASMGADEVSRSVPVAAVAREGAMVPRGAAPIPPSAPGAPAGPREEPVPEGRGSAPFQATDEPEVLLAELLDAPGGVASRVVRLGPGFTQYGVEAFVIEGLEWAGVERRFQAARDPFVSLDAPDWVHPDDHAWGRVTAGSRSGRMRLSVTRDGVAVPFTVEGRTLGASDEIAGGRVEAAFVALPGDHEVRVTDVGSGATDVHRRRIEVPGKMRRRARSLRILQPGESVARGGDVKGLRVLPSLDHPFRALVDATADYGHACCEQTAAKILAACAMYAMADGDATRRNTAEAIIIAGVDREKRMWLRGRGFKMYPESTDVPNDFWGQGAARHLWNLDLLKAASPGPTLLEAIEAGLEMAADATRAYGLAWPPQRPATMEDAYGVARFSHDAKAREAAVALARSRGPSLAESGPTAPAWGGAVAMRAESAFAAATLLRGRVASDVPLALRLANRVTADLGPDGRLYSTVDSVAAIALVAELREGALGGGAARVEVNGRTLAGADAVSLAGDIHEVGAVEGSVTVEVEREVEEDWGAFGAGVDMRVALERDGRAVRTFHPGDAIELDVTLEKGYKAGDILWVCLPDALARLVGGAQVKRFAVDFAGQDRIRVPLVATALTARADGTPGRQHFAACVRNMFEEERGASPGFLSVTVER